MAAAGASVFFLRRCHQFYPKNPVSLSKISNHHNMMGLVSADIEIMKHQILT